MKASASRELPLGAEVAVPGHVSGGVKARHQLVTALGPKDGNGVPPFCQRIKHPRVNTHWSITLLDC